MRRLIPWVLVLTTACGGAATTSTTLVEQTTAAGLTTVTEAAASTTEAAPSTTQADEASGTVIPPGCAEGFIEYLKTIEPVVAFDPATATFGDFFVADDAAGEKGIELMTANGSAATYSCSEVGLEFAYFDSRSPWEAIHVIANEHAPGTVAYLEGKEAVTAIDNAQLTDYGVESCDAAAERIQQTVSEQLAAGTEDVDGMSFDAGLELLGVYNAYLADVRDGACPPDVLGNDEFGFMGAH